jgi:hypothetical protein
MHKDDPKVFDVKKKALPSATIADVSQRLNNYVFLCLSEMNEKGIEKMR